MISIIVPIYRVEEYLTECIQSILNQTYQNLEVILVNDGSPDGCPDICERFAKQDSRIKVIHKENGGLVSARKAGIAASSGKYIGYVDGDDWIESDMYEKMYESIKRYDADVVATGHYRDLGKNNTIVTNGLPSGVYEGELIRKIVLNKLLYTGEFYQYGLRVNLWNKLFKRELILPSQYAVSEKINYGEDVACILPVFLSSQCVVVDNTPYYHYRQRPGSITKRYCKNEIDSIKILFQYLYGCISKSKSFSSLLKQLYYFIFYKILYRCPEVFWTDNSLKPFDCVPENSRIILYGAGDFGRALYTSIININFCQVVLWTDRFAESYVSQGLPVNNIDLIGKLDYDYIVMAVANLSKTAKKDTINLLLKNKVEPERIVWIDYKYLEKPELLIKNFIDEWKMEVDSVHT